MNKNLAIVTGANSGIGFEVSRYLAHHGHSVIIASRNIERGKTAQNILRAETGNHQIYFEQLDLASLNSIREFASCINAKYGAIKILVNNGGLMMPPRSWTADGFEMQFGVNYLSHFALTGLLLNALTTAQGSRVVTVSSIVHRFGKIAFDDVNLSQNYHSGLCYRQSKLACLMFSYELQRRLHKADANCLSIAAHPGISSTNLSRFFPRWIQGLSGKIFQTPAKGALPLIDACVNPNLLGGEYIGPDGPFGIYGDPSIQRSSNISYSKQDAKKLWELSQHMTGVAYL